MKQYSIFQFLVFVLTLFACHRSTAQTTQLHPADFNDIFQRVLDLPALQPYYHIDSDSSRSQVVFKYFGDANHNNLIGVYKFGKQVMIMSEEEIKQRKILHYFVVGDWACINDKVRIQIAYPIEGLVVSYV
jgi:hypothetical protein